MYQRFWGIQLGSMVLVGALWAAPAFGGAHAEPRLTVIYDTVDPVTTDNTLFLYPEHDSFIDQHDPDANKGSNGRLYVRTWDGKTPEHNDDWEMDALVSFDLALIPPAAIVTGATLSLYYDECGMGPGCAGRTHTCYPITGAWDESTVTWNNQPGIGDLTDSATVPPEPGVWVTWVVLSDVVEYLAGGDLYGWEIKDEGVFNEYDIPYVMYRSKEAVPTLSEWGVVVMTLLVLAAGTVVLIRRRRLAAQA